MIVNFLMVSTLTYTMEEQSIRSRSYSMNDIIQEGNRAEDQGNRKRAEELYFKAFRYKKFEKTVCYSEFVAAVIAGDQIKERTLSQELDQHISASRSSENLNHESVQSGKHNGNKGK